MDKTRLKILIVDDEEDILEFLTHNFHKENYNVRTASGGNEALRIARDFKPDLVLLDIMLPDMDGIEVCGELRKDPVLSKVIIIILTARSEDYSQVAGFEAGADDYICKPIKPKILISRINAIVKRINCGTGNIERATEQVVLNKIIIDKDKHLVILNGKSYELTRKEFEMLSLLAAKPERVFSREEIYLKIWGSSIISGNRTIDVHIRRIREKLNADFIKTIKGVGYKYKENL